MHFFITGASGFLGGNIVPLFLKEKIGITKIDSIKGVKKDIYSPFQMF